MPQYTKDVPEGPVGTVNDPAEVKSVRFGANQHGMRIVIELSKKCDYDIHSIKDSSQIYLNIYDAELSPGFRLPNYKPDKLVGRCQVEQYNLRQVQMTIPLSYGVPIDNVDVFTLEEPNRIVIDILREYNNFIQFHITKNIAWLQVEKAEDGRFTLINELFVNYKSPDVNVDIEMAKNGGKNRETVTDMVKRKNAVAGVNGGYFSNSGQNLGLVVIDGKIKASSVKKRPARTAFGITFDKEIIFNRVHDKNGALVPKWGKPWKEVVLALGAGPRLISEGKVHITADQEGLGKNGNNITRRTGRTALGVTKDGKLAFFTVSGFRSNHKDGVKLDDLAQYMKIRKIHNAMNFDGGGSTAMSIMGYLVSKPPGQNFQRPVANGVLIYDKSPIISPRYAGFEPTEIVMPADGKTTTDLKILVVDANEKPVPDKTPVSFASGVGLFEKKYFYTKNGLVTIPVKSVRAPGNYSIKMDCGPLQAFIPMKLTTGDAAQMTVSCIPSGKSNGNGNGGTNGKNGKNGSNGKGQSFIVKALVRDQYKNPLKGRVVKFEVVEGEGRFSCANAMTKPNGEADTTFTLCSDKAKIMISSQGMDSVYKDF